MFFSATVSSSWRAYPACLTAWTTNLRPTRCFERPCKDSSAAFGFGMTTSRVCYRATTHKVARVLQSHREMLDVSLCLCDSAVNSSWRAYPACLTAWSIHLKTTRRFSHNAKDSPPRPYACWSPGFGMTSSRLCYRATTHKVARVLQSHREMLDVSLCLCDSVV